MSEPYFPRPFKWMHWISAVLILLMLIAGQRFGGEMSDADRSFSLMMHSSLGVLVTLLVASRLACRFSGFARPPANTLGTTQNRIARLVQGALYALLIALPITGVLTARAHELPVRVLGLLDISTGNTASFDQMRLVHQTLTWAIIALLVLHIGAGLLHALKRDGVMNGMNPFKKHFG